MLCIVRQEALQMRVIVARAFETNSAPLWVFSTHEHPAISEKNFVCPSYQVYICSSKCCGACLDDGTLWVETVQPKLALSVKKLPFESCLLLVGSESRAPQVIVSEERGV